MLSGTTNYQTKWPRTVIERGPQTPDNRQPQSGAGVAFTTCWAVRDLFPIHINRQATLLYHNRMAPGASAPDLVPS
jgi:hypothetical protein